MPGVEAQVPQPAEVEGQHGQHHALRRERLGRGDADLRPGVQVDAAVGLLGDRAAHHVADGQRRVPLAFHFAQGRQRVGRLAALRDGEQQRAGCRAADCDSAVRWRIPPRPECGPTASIRYSPTSAACQLVPQAVSRIRSTERSCCGVRFKPPKCGRGRRRRSSRPRMALRDRFGLLEDLLEHVVLVAAAGRRRPTSMSSSLHVVRAPAPGRGGSRAASRR